MVPFLEHSITLSLRKSKPWLKFNILIVRSTEAVVRGKEKLFLNISQYSEENAHVLESLLIMLQAFRPATLLKREFNTGVFSSEYCEISKNIYFEEHL